MTVRKLLSIKELKPSVKRMLFDNGIELVVAGSTEVNYKLDETTKSALRELNGAVVVTSVHGVNSMTLHTGDNLPGVTDLFCLAGETLSSSLRLNIPIRASALDADSLAWEIINSGIKKITFVCSDHHRHELPELLHENGIQVHLLKAYDVTIIAEKLNKAFDYVLFFSPRSAAAFLEKNRLDENVACFCIGATTARFVKDIVNNTIVTAPFPSQECLAEKVIQFVKSKERKFDPGYEVSETI